MLQDECDARASEFYSRFKKGGQSAICDFIDANRGLPITVAVNLVNQWPPYLRVRHRDELVSIANETLATVAHDLAKRKPAIRNLGAYLTTSISRAVRKAANDKELFGDAAADRRFRKRIRRSPAGMIWYRHCKLCQAGILYDVGNCGNCGEYLGDKVNAGRIITTLKRSKRAFSPKEVYAPDADDRYAESIARVFAACQDKIDEQIVILRSEGCTDAVTAEALKVSESTVRNRRHEIEQEHGRASKDDHRRIFHELIAELEVETEVALKLSKDDPKDGPRPTPTINGPCFVFITYKVDAPDIDLTKEERVEFVAYETKQVFWKFHAKRFIAQLRRTEAVFAATRESSDDFVGGEGLLDQVLNNGDLVRRSKKNRIRVDAPHATLAPWHVRRASVCLPIYHPVG